MGLSPFSNCDTKRDGNPKSYNFSIKEVFSHEDMVAIKIRYPDCTNYNGNKILVYKGLYTKAITKLNEIDPHFLENGFSPIARFRPTPEGWEMAKKLCKGC